MLKNAINALSQAIIGLSKDMDVPAGNGDIVYAHNALDIVEQYFDITPIRRAVTESESIQNTLERRAYLIFLMATAIQYLCGGHVHG